MLKLLARLLGGDLPELVRLRDAALSFPKGAAAGEQTAPEGESHGREGGCVLVVAVEVFEKDLPDFDRVADQNRAARADTQRRDAAGFAGESSENPERIPGNLVIISAYAVHRIPSLWQNPEEFRPERFAPGQEEQKNKFAYLPFGAGPRICMGMSFAMIESQIILGTLLSRFRTRLANPDTIVPQTQVTLRPDQTVLLALEKIG